MTYSLGDTVFCAEDINVATNLGKQRVAVRWGDPGEVVGIRGDAYNIQWVSRLGDGSFEAERHGGQVLRQRPRWSEGQLVQFTRDIHFRSSRVARRNCIAVVLDMLLQDGPCSVLVRAVPFGSQEAFDFCVADADIQPASMPEGIQPSTGPLPGNYEVGEAVYATADVSNDTGVIIGRGDTGLVVGVSPKADTLLLVRFECRQDTGDVLWTSLPPDRVTRDSQLCRGRRIVLAKAAVLRDRPSIPVGTLGLLLEDSKAAAGAERSALLQIATESSGCISFQAPCHMMQTLRSDVWNDTAKEARLRELENLAMQNEAKGLSIKTVSLLEQNLWELYGFGSGLGISFLDRERSPVLGNLLRCRVLKKHKHKGLDGTLGLESEAVFDHNALVSDNRRCEPYHAAIRRFSQGRRVLDIGTGPFCFLSRLCMLAGADTVEAIEASTRSVVAATEAFRFEEASQGKHRGAAASKGVPEWASLDVREVAQSGGQQPTLQVGVKREGGSEMQKLSLYHGLSTDTSLPLSGGYNMLIHEILGDFAGTEGAAAVVADIRARGLTTPDCVFVPRASSTMLAPTSPLLGSALERLLFRLRNGGHALPEPCTRYSARYFRREDLLAEPQPLEVIDFQGGPELLQKRRLVFTTERDGKFDGVHMHLFVDLDGQEEIDALQLHSTRDTCSWSTMYVRLLAEPLELCRGSRIIVDCVADLQADVARYSIEVFVDQGDEERKVSSFAWEGA
eukprot:TRINITY_DN42176_c0_g1_i1.p1 TRINITY_DN42176_c0_g1~~TRINITY_DN42176_c0_g1_i1.p1  ORF type:complete len:773 (-),score=144.33 TRINITY_DN42176_c0_g1_i1:30-2231(-)